MTRLIGRIQIGRKVIPMRSPVSNFMYLLYGALACTTNPNVVDTSNTVRTAGSYFSGSSYGWRNGETSDPALGVDTYGIQVGSNATAVALSDYKLNTQITHGTGAGQLKYSGQSGFGPISSGSSRAFRLSRYFTNDSGGDVTIREVGLVQRPNSSGGVIYLVLVCRDLTGDIVVSDTNAVPVEFTWQVTA